MESFLFLRHGETSYNAKGLWTGSTNISLSTTGVSAIQRLASSLCHGAITKIYSSPLLRALETAEIIASSTSAKIEIVDGLAERSFGIYEGKSKAMFPQEALLLDDSVESEESLSRRVELAVGALDLSPSTLVVSHSWIYRTLICHLKCQADPPRDFIKNAELVRLKISR